MMGLGLRGKGALVVASNSELGKVIALELCQEGAKVILFSSFEERLKKTQAEIAKETGNQPEFLTGSITNTQNIEDLVQTTVEEYGSVFTLVNNMGGSKPGVFNVFSDQDWQDAYGLCLLSYIRTIRTILPSMHQSGGGRTLCSISSSVKAVLDNPILFSTFRMGVMGLAKTLSQELSKDHVPVNVIDPGHIGTDRIDQLDIIRAQKQGIAVKGVQQQTYQTIPMGRYGKPEEYGRLAAFLCSKADIFITGQTVLVDSGVVKAF